MVKNFCLFFSLKTGAFIVAFINLTEGVSEFITGIVQLYFSTTEGHKTLFVVCLLVGIITILNAVLLINALVQAKDRRILMYIIIKSAILLTITIYSGVTMFTEKWLLLLFIYSSVSWYFQMCVYSFYEETVEYNKVTPGVIEIAYNERNGNASNLSRGNSAYESDAV